MSNSDTDVKPTDTRACSACSGNGILYDRKKCLYCHGYGRIPYPPSTKVKVGEKCPNCGVGALEEDGTVFACLATCRACKGWWVLT